MNLKYGFIRLVCSVAMFLLIFIALSLLSVGWAGYSQKPMPDVSLVLLFSMVFGALLGMCVEDID